MKKCQDGVPILNSCQWEPQIRGEPPIPSLSHVDNKMTELMLFQIQVSPSSFTATKNLPFMYFLVTVVSMFPLPPRTRQYNNHQQTLLLLLSLFLTVLNKYIMFDSCEENCLNAAIHCWKFFLNSTRQYTVPELGNHQPQLNQGSSFHKYKQGGIKGFKALHLVSSQL